MKKLLLAVAFCAAAVLGSVNAQEAPKEGGFYAGLHTGYNFTIAGQRNYDLYSLLGPYSFFEPMNINYGKVEVPSYSLGKGLTAGLHLGYFFGSNVGAELSADYLFGAKNSYSPNVKYHAVNNDIYARMIQLKPMFVVRGSNPSLTPYAKIGFVFGLGSKIFFDANAMMASTQVDAAMEKSGGTAIGFTGAGGVKYSINNKIKIGGEVNFVGLTYAPEKGSITKFIENGVDVLSTLDTDQREFLYEESVDQIGSPSSTSPSKMPKTSYNFNSLGIALSATYTF